MAAVATVFVVVVALAAVGPAWGQAVPSRPAAPTSPASPPAPRAPGSSELALAFLFVGARTAAPGAVELRLADALIGLFPERRAPARTDVMPLATRLAESLGRRDLSPDARRRLAAHLAPAFTTIVELEGGDLDPALAAVHEALAEVGLGTSDIVVIETEVRRLGRDRRPRHR